MSDHKRASRSRSSTRTTTLSRAPFGRVLIALVASTALLSGALGGPAQAYAEPCETPRTCDFTDEPIIVTPKASAPPRSAP
jgi:hypothetical protein